MTLSEYYLNNADTSIRTKSILSSYVYTFLYAFGIHDERLVQKKYDRLMQMKYLK